VILYGPPAAGKDTITRALAKVDRRYTMFARLKVGSGRRIGYRMATPEQLHELETCGDVIYANSRYGNTYAIDRPGLAETFASGVPVVHLGQIEGIHALVEGYPADWVRVLLWCPQSVTMQRSVARGDTNTAARVAAWDETGADLEAHREVAWDLVVGTSTTTPEQAAHHIHQLLAGKAETVE
jgi:guanylate kinase